MSNNAAERTLRCVALGRNHWTFVGSDERGRRAAGMYALFGTAKLNYVVRGEMQRQSRRMHPADPVSNATAGIRAGSRDLVRRGSFGFLGGESCPDFSATFTTIAFEQ